MEPRFKKQKKENEKPKTHQCGGDMTKKTKFLRLGYTKTPRKQKVRTIKCPAGKENCKNCKGANVISPEAIARGTAKEEVKVVCCSEGGEGHCCGEE